MDAGVLGFVFGLGVQVRVWVDEISSEWNFQQIIPAHYSAPIKARPADFRSAFDFLDGLVGGAVVKPEGVRGALMNIFGFFSKRSQE